MKKILTIAILCLLAGCNLPRQGGGEISQEDRVITAAAQTVAALQTSTAAGTPAPARVTVTPAFTPTFQASGTPAASLTPTSSEPCNQASFDRDATIPDGSVLPPNTRFTKTWLIKNTGSCAWNTGYTIVFGNKGTAMTGQASFPLISQGEIKPGEIARVSVNLNAPSEFGEYQGYWRLRSDQQQEFGTGSGGGGDFFVQINVAEAYSFARLACSAEWSTGAKALPCPGSDSDTDGYVILADNPSLEDGNEHEGPGILVKTQPVAGGYIVGKFPAVVVPVQSDFRATLSCQPGASGCFVRFKVTYRVDGGDEQVLGEWNEGYEGGVTNAVKDLDMVAGRSTEFYFYVYATGNPDDSRAVWFDPRIVK